MGDPKFVKRYRHAGRPGLYCRVIQEGAAREGDEIRVERYMGETISIAEMFHVHYEKDKSEATLRRQLNAPIAIRSRVSVEQKLETFLTKK